MNLTISTGRLSPFVIGFSPHRLDSSAAPISANPMMFAIAIGRNPDEQEEPSDEVGETVADDFPVEENTFTTA